MMITLLPQLHKQCLFLFLLTITLVAEPVSGKDPLPDELQRSESIARISTSYAKELSEANAPGEKTALAKRFMAEIEKHDDSADRFAFLRLSLDLVRAAEDWDTAILVVREMQDNFEIDSEASQRQLKFLKDKKKAASKKKIKFSDTPSTSSNGDMSVDDSWPEDSDQIVIDLEMPYETAVLGASGDVIVLLLTLKEKLAIFDVNARKIKHEIPLENANVKFCVGADSIYLAYPEPNTIERWSLKTYKKLKSSKLPFQNPIEHLVVGRDTNGPILAGAEHEPGMFLDGKSLRPIPTRVFDRQYQRVGQLPGAGPATRMRASANGKVFSIWGTSGSPGGFRTLVMKGNTVDTYYAHDTMGYIAPSPMGDLMYTAKGIYTTQTKEYAVNKELHARSFFIPAIDSEFSISLVRSDDRDAAAPARANIHVRGNPQPITTLPRIAFRPGGYGEFHNRAPMPIDLRIFLFAKRGLLLTLPETNRQIVYHRIGDLDTK